MENYSKLNLKHEITKLNAIIEERLEIDDINVREKKGEQVLGRMVACNILMDNGLTPAMLSKYYCKDRANFYHYRKKHNIYMEYEKSYPEYIQLYNYAKEEYVKRAKDISALSKLQRLELVDDINERIDTLRRRKKEVLETL